MGVDEGNLQVIIYLVKNFQSKGLQGIDSLSISASFLWSNRCGQVYTNTRVSVTGAARAKYVRIHIRTYETYFIKKGTHK